MRKYGVAFRFRSRLTVGWGGRRKEPEGGNAPPLPVIASEREGAQAVTRLAAVSCGEEAYVTGGEAITRECGGSARRVMPPSLPASGPRSVVR